MSDHSLSGRSRWSRRPAASNSGGGRNKGEWRRIHHLLDEWVSFGAVPQGRQEVHRFPEHVLRNQQGFVNKPRPSHRPGVERIPGFCQRNQVATVGQNHGRFGSSSRTLVSTAMSTRWAGLGSIKQAHTLVHQLAALGVGKQVAARPQMLRPPAGGGLEFGGRTGLFRFHRANRSTSAGRCAISISRRCF